MLSSFRRIEIELHSYCNRKCPWCPNNKIDRSFYKELPEETFIELMYHIKENNFGTNKSNRLNKSPEPHIITFNRFCEPMSHIDLLKKRVNQARNILPYVLYSVNTNGDFLTPENIDDLYLDNLFIMDYDCIGKEGCIKKLADNNIWVFKDNPDKNILTGIHKTIGKVLCSYDWPKTIEIEDRAGFFKEDITWKGHTLKWANNKAQRTVPCIEPTYYISIDYNGNVTPCCHIRADNPEHAQYVMGNITKEKLADIVNSDKWIEFRERVSSNDYENYPDICKTCAKIRTNKKISYYIDNDIYT
jgi:radical SAM protein with 4Fe4S-binding SPASM domain